MFGYEHLRAMLYFVGCVTSDYLSSPIVHYARDQAPSGRAPSAGVVAPGCDPFLCSKRKLRGERRSVRLESPEIQRERQGPTRALTWAEKV